MESKLSEALCDKLTPVEIKNKEFKRTLWGYSPAEVVDFLDRTAKVWDKVQRREKEILEKLKGLEDDLVKWKAKETELTGKVEMAANEAQKIKEDAQKEAAKILEEVNTKADEIRGRTEEWLVNVIAEVEETERKRDSFVSAFRAALDQHYALLDNGQDGLKPLEAQLDKFLQERPRPVVKGQQPNRVKPKPNPEIRPNLS
jgi:cell division initiation protein